MIDIPTVAEKVAIAAYEASNPDGILLEVEAALRVVVDQVTPVSTNLRQTKIRQELLAIADELQFH